MNAYKGLLVEDEPILQKVHGFFLEDLGYAVDLAKNGIEACNCIAKEHYDFILLDNGLPDMQGVEICKKVRKQQKDDKKQPVAIIFLTANPSFEEVCFDAGCDDFIVKPTNRKALGQLIEHWVGRYKKWNNFCL